MKLCRRCSTIKPETEFAKRGDGLQSWCRECFAARARDLYQSSPEERARKLRNKHRLDAENKSKMTELLQNSECADCGNTDWRVFEFDHRDPSEKNHNISEMLLNRSWAKIQEEMSKCDIVCANCHRLRTIAQFGTWRSTATQVLVTAS